MIGVYIFLGVVAFGLFAYLILALFKPEMFS